MNFLQNKNLDFKRIQEAVVLFAIACLTNSYFGGYYLIITTIGHHRRLLREIAVVCLFLKVLTTRYNKKEFCCVGIMLLLAYISYRYSGNTRALYNFLTICALKDVDLKKVFKAALVSLCFIVVLLAVLALLGVTGKVSVTENFGRGAEISTIETRYYMGYIHPNTWAQAVFTIFLLIVINFYEKIDWKGIIVLFLANYGLYRLAVSRTCFLCGIAMIVLLIWAKYGKKLFEFLIIRIGIVAGVAAVWGIIFTSRINIAENLTWTIIDWKIFTGRLLQAKVYLETCGLSAFGAHEPDTLDNGYILDMGYMRMLLENGVVIFALMFIMTIAVLLYAFKQKRNDIVIVTICICLYGIYENLAIAQIPANLILYYVSALLFQKKRDYAIIN